MDFQIYDSRLRKFGGEGAEQAAGYLSKSPRLDTDSLTIHSNAGTQRPSLSQGQEIFTNVLFFIFLPLRAQRRLILLHLRDNYQMSWGHNWGPWNK